MPGDFVSLENDVQPVFDANCVFGGCHSGAIPAEGLSLEADQIFDPQLGLVDIPSVQANLLRVQRGSAMGSYLINKLEGTQLSVGGSGLQMPRFAQPLPDATIQIIKDWIDEGAQDN